ncbi:protein-glutamate O-methyltransferase [Fodinicurvata sp. EGI_FJ10296]|uniref:CheR family methyltransferase n=1 Tax=Fodinicurvata sp. EGI_FJ10296 TaxID=3231908 RepID=UPI0034558658
MKTDDFNYLRTLLHQRSGLVVTPDKSYLLESRLMPVARKWQVKSLDDLVQLARTRRQESLLNDITEAMTTNESSFFRDSKPFELFKSVVLPHLLEARSARKSFRIWSAACSSGQEPYSLAMLLHEEAARLRGWKIEIVGTDLSTEMIDRCRAGVYTQFEIQRGLPITHLVKYFKQVGDKWYISDELKKMVTWRTFNLLDNMSGLGQFDVVFCRNVLIYFDQANKTKVLDGISKVMPADGHLFLGGAETVLGVSDRFRPVDGRRGLYEPAAKAAGSVRGGQPALAQSKS